MRAAVFAAVFAVASGCDRGGTRDQPPLKQPSMPLPTATTPIPAPACTLQPRPLRRPMPKRLVAIGDLHGDLAATRTALRLAGAIDAHDRWSGGDLVVVQTGDVLDRGDDEQAILDLLFALEPQAAAAGGALVFLMGNHELMNAAGDFRYVTPGAVRDFDDAPGLDTARWQRVPEEIRGRIAALGPGGVYAKRFAEHDVVTIIGDTVFSHAGVLGEWATQVDAANMSSRCWLDGQAGGPEAAPAVLTSDDSPVWTRAYGGADVDCDALKTALAKLGAKRMVVGHTVQRTGITSTCDGAAWRIDVGLGKLYGGPIEVLELGPDGPKVLEGTRE